jgi:hypothetical protein
MHGEIKKIEQQDKTNKPGLQQKKLWRERIFTLP